MILYREIIDINACKIRIKIASLGYERGPKESCDEKEMNCRIMILS